MTGNGGRVVAMLNPPPLAPRPTRRKASGGTIFFQHRITLKGASMRRHHDSTKSPSGGDVSQE